MQSALANIWCNPRNIIVNKIYTTIFKISIDRTENHSRILKGSLWVFRNSLLILQELDRKKSISSLEFSKAPIWVQIWGLLINGKTFQMGMTLGEVIGEVLEASVYEIPDKTEITKVRINLKINSPIMLGMYIGRKNNGVNWIYFHYERLSMFCFYCGYIGHIEEH